MPLQIVRNRKHDANKAADSDHELTKYDVLEGCKNFQDCYSLDPGQGSLNAPLREVLIGALEALIAPIHDEDHAYIAVYHGLRGNTLVHGFKAIHVAQNTFDPILVDSLPSHELRADGTLFAIEEDWSVIQSNYFTNMQAKRVRSINATGLKELYDPKVVTFPWSREIKKMYYANEKLIANYELFRLVMANYSMYHREYIGKPRGYNGPNGYRHAVCFYTQRSYDEGNTWIDMLDEGDNVSAYEYRGTNLGHLCPPRCRKTTEVGKP
jgi:hypothetical protein